MWRTWKVNKVKWVVGAGPKKKKFEQKGSCLPFKYLNRLTQAFVKQLLQKWYSLLLFSVHTQ